MPRLTLQPGPNEPGFLYAQMLPIADIPESRRSLT